jgi:hypothetical protein
VDAQRNHARRPPRRHGVQVIGTRCWTNFHSLSSEIRDLNTKTTYRSRGAVREVGKALGLPEDVTGSLAGMIEKEAQGLNLNLEDRRLWSMTFRICTSTM